jgi:hypothetical protein
MQEIEDDSFEFCWNCNEPRAKVADETWLCSVCGTKVEGDFAFCSNCGQPKAQKKEPESQPTKQSSSPIQAVETQAIVPSPVSISVQQAVPMPAALVYDTSIFASQFPVWDLLPPVMLVRRIKRSL